MSDLTDPNPSAELTPETTTEAADDARKPYEPPRLVKKRSVARATLYTVMGPSMTGITFMG